MKKRFLIPLLLIVALVALRLALPTIIKNYVNKVLDNLEGYQGYITDVDLSLYRGAYAIDSLVLEKTDGEVPVPFVEIARTDLSVEWSALFDGKLVGEIMLTHPKVNFVASKNGTASQTGEETDWTQPIKDLFPLEINRFEIVNGALAFYDFSTEPKIEITMDSLDAVATNLTNATSSADTLPSDLKLTARTLGGGRLDVDMQMNVLKEIPDLNLNLRFENAELAAFNDFTKAYGNFDVEEGQFGLYTELAVNDGQIGGYLKPFLDDVKILKWKEEEESDGFFKKLYEGLVGTVLELFENQSRDEVATRIPLQGDLNAPDVPIWPTIGGVVRNAFFAAFERELEGSVNFSDAAQ